MAYTKTTWKNRVVQNPNTYLQQQNADGTVTLVPKEGTVTEAGTPVNAVNMNHIEDGIATVDTNLGNINDSALDASVKGKSLTNMIKVLFQNVNNGKNSVYSAIVDKGTTPASKDFADLVAGINDIGGKQDLSDYLLNLPEYYEPIGFVDGEGLWCTYIGVNIGLEFKAALFNSSGTLVKSISLTVGNTSARDPYQVTDDYILWSRGDAAYTVAVSDKQGNHISSYTTNVPDAGNYPNPNGGCLNDKAGIVYVHTSSSDFIIYNINGTLLHTVHVASMDTVLYMVPIKGGIIAGCQNSNTKDLNVILIKDNGDSKVIDAKNFGVGQIFSNTIKL